MAIAERLDESRSDAFPTSVSALQLPFNAHNFSSTLASLKRSTLSPQNRLRSIQHDSHFVQSIASERGLPLIANERCGSWYIHPEQKQGSAYFKSTDGHFGEWAFSMRRLNLQILATIGAAGGCVIVDSTRRGKCMPDALSKTVPIWCVVLNRLLFPERVDTHNLRTPKSSVGASEFAQIKAGINGFVQDAESLQFDIPALRLSLKKPLIPSWITPDFEDLAADPLSGEYNRIICCTASRRVQGTEASEDGYIQGAADDHEGWSHGLTPLLFWEHREELLEMPEKDIPEFVHYCLATEQSHGINGSHAVRIAPTDLYLGTLSDTVRRDQYDALIEISSEACLPPGEDENSDKKGPSILQVQCKSGKLGSRALRTHFDRIIAFLSPLFSSNNSTRILIMCHDGKDLSVGVALAVLCFFYDDQYNPKSVASLASIDKTVIRRRLAKITAAKPDASPSRTTLQSVHAFLMP